MKKVFLLLVAVSIAATSFAQSKWTVDPVHSTVKFSVAHLVISEVEGSFKKFSGDITAANPDFTGASIAFSVDVNSINTDNEMRDKHLKSDDFFNSEKYPLMVFKSTSFKKVSGNKYLLIGNLTIRNVTKLVKFNVTYGGQANDGYGNVKAGFKASGSINRFDYGLKYNSLTEAGGATVGKDIAITLNLEFAKPLSAK